MRRSVRHWARVSAALFGISVAAAQPARAQTVMVTPSTDYERGALWRMMFGEAWRELWVARIEVPVLDIGTFKGGLEPFQQGGNQSKTLRMRGADGRTYIFRSTDKNIMKAMPDDLKDTPIGHVIQDQTAAFHPSSALVVAELQESVGVLQARPQLVFMPDDPRLGEYRDAFKNTLGMIEERPEEATKGKSFADADDLDGTDKLLENLEESTGHRLDARAYLTARLIDFLIGDTDRGADQWRWAQFKDDLGSVYVPIPRDRDYAFMEVEGLLLNLGAMAYPKLVNFNDKAPKLRSMVFMTREFDRTHLAVLDRAVWDSVVTHIQKSLSDEVIDRAVAQMPEPHRKISGAEIRSGLRSRRDQLPEMAAAYYRMVTEDAEVYASDDDERADIERHADGSVSVTLYGPGKQDKGAPEAVVYRRRFLPAETDEIRVHMERGDDRVVVRGSVERSIELRVMGGEGDDVLIDSSMVANGDKTSFYDASGKNAIVGGANTRVITEPYVTSPPQRSLDKEENEEPVKNPRKIDEERRGRFQDLMNAQADFIDQKTKSDETRTWGKVSTWSPLVAFREGNGLVLGFGPTTTDYGFRRRPYEWQVAARGMIGMTGRLGVQLDAHRYFETTKWSVSLFSHATQLETNRFFGYGNESELSDIKASLRRRDEILVEPALEYALGGKSRFSVGPVARYVRDEFEESYSQFGMRADVSLLGATRTTTTQKGFDLNIGASVFPGSEAPADGPLGGGRLSELHATAALFVPLGRPTLAFRVGGKTINGDWPLHDGAFIGGRETLRGYRFNRFVGDASAFGSAELRLPVARVTLLTRGDLGILGFTDAGRVWLDGESSDTWHTSNGAGVWFGSLGQAVTLTYARGEESRVYISLGLPF